MQRAAAAQRRERPGIADGTWVLLGVGCRMSDVGRVYGRSRRRDCAIPAGAADVRSGVWDAADEALLAGYGSGDATAAAAFVRRFQRRVYGLARSVVGDDGLAAEVAQDAFVKAW
ncbi:MAG: hypothetical protein KDB17_19140, partial [Ilumatobacter sp.]|nr:hypothetical protein [Ilumatobacter sp.]